MWDLITTGNDIHANHIHGNLDASHNITQSIVVYYTHLNHLDNSSSEYVLLIVGILIPRGGEGGGEVKYSPRGSALHEFWVMVSALAHAHAYTRPRSMIGLV